MANAGIQPINEQPLDLSKKELTISVIKESDTSSRNTASPCGPKEDTLMTPTLIINPDTDLEDSPLIIDEETTTDSAEVRRTLSNNEALPKVIVKRKFLIV